MNFKRGDVIECTFSNHPWVEGERYVIKGLYSDTRYRITHSLYGRDYSFPERYMKPCSPLEPRQHIDRHIFV